MSRYIPDISAEPAALGLSFTERFQVGRHISVPIKLPDGSVFGMFCCFGHEADPSLRDRDLQVMRAFAELIAFEIGRDLEAVREMEAKRLRIRGLIDELRLAIVYQPIWDVSTGRAIGVECLTRFSPLPYRAPDQWFNEAAEAGLSVELELLSVRLGLSALAELPPDAYVTVNVSPATALSPGLGQVLQGYDRERIILELTEQTDIEDYDQLLEALLPLRRSGLRLAIDDAGAGYASLQRILYLQPDVIKLDMDCTRDIDRDPMRRAVASVVIQFARETGRKVIAEGVETEVELATLKSIGIERAQGYFLARPLPLEEVLKFFAPEAALANA